MHCYFSCLSFTLTLVCIWSTVSSQEVLQTTNNLSVKDLITDVFIKGNCKNVDNISSIGDPNLSIGEFSKGDGILGFKDGIIISTGDISLAPGPNIALDATYAFDIVGSDPDLDLLATDSLFDITAIEFDFVPIDNKVKFRYVFASEEYCEFVGTDFNDVFGFFVSGPGINGPFANNAINVATLSGTDTNVSINNINHLLNQEYYVSNATNEDVQNCDIIYIDDFQDVLEYDGFTVPLIASFNVIPCETYHIRLVIGDVGDPNLDSAVFLESKSFDLGEKVTVQAEVPGREEPIAYESCIDGQIVFTRGDLADLNRECTVDYIIDPLSNAVNGVDFEEIPLSITIAAGDTSAILPINVINDLVPEGPESFRLLLEYPCNCLDPGLSELTIEEPPVLSVISDSIFVCAGQPFYLKPEITSGLEPYEFLWENGTEEDSIELVVTEPSRYSVTITDVCGKKESIAIDIKLQSDPSAFINGTYSSCNGVEIPIEFEGNPPWAISYSLNGIEQDPVSGIETNPYLLNTSQEGIYVINTFSDAFCSGTTIGMAEVVSPFDLEVDIVHPTCFNSSDGSIRITSIKAKEPVTLRWNNDDTDKSHLEDLRAGLYTLTVIDVDGCTFMKDFELISNSEELKECLSIYIPNTFSPNRIGPNQHFKIFLGSDSKVTEITSFQIYNRWGEKLNDQRNIDPANFIGWDGRYKGQLLSPNVFIYLVSLTLEDGTILYYSGDVSLVN